MASVVGELNFSFYLALTNLSLNLISHMWPVVIPSDTAALDLEQLSLTEEAEGNE